MKVISHQLYTCVQFYWSSPRCDTLRYFVMSHSNKYPASEMQLVEFLNKISYLLCLNNFIFYLYWRVCCEYNSTGWLYKIMTTRFSFLNVAKLKLTTFELSVHDTLDWTIDYSVRLEDRFRSVMLMPKKYYWSKLLSLTVHPESFFI